MICIIHLASESQVTDTDSQLTDTDSQLTDTDSQLTDTDSQLTDTDLQLTDTDSKLTDTDSQHTDTDSQNLATILRQSFHNCKFLPPGGVRFQNMFFNFYFVKIKLSHNSLAIMKLQTDLFLVSINYQIN
jgi:hypothetical protein